MNRVGPIRLQRRSVLRGAGVALALPFLDVMRPAHANAAPTPQRFVTFYTPGGTLLDQWLPTGTETAFKMGPILSGLTAHQRLLTFVTGLDMASTADAFGHPHTRGCASLFTGHPNNPGPYETDGGKAGFANGPSLDQTIAGVIGTKTRLRSLEVAVRWPSSNFNGLRIAPPNCISFAGPDKPIPVETNPRQIWRRLFRDLALGPEQAGLEQRRRQSIVDAVKDEYTAIIPRVSVADRAKLQAHLDRVNELERAVAVVAPADRSSCRVPPIETSFDHNADALMPRTGKLLTDLMIMAFACDLTRVATLQWVDSSAENKFPWLGLPETHHGYQHDRGFQPDAIFKISKWYAEQFQYLLDGLAAVDDGGQNLLESAAVLWGTEIQHPNTHAHNDMPFLLAGSAGGALRTGRFLRFNHRPHNDLLLTVAQAFGVPGRTFGKARYCTGSLPGLT